MPNTPVYGWPYQSLGDPPDGAALGEELGLAIEATMADVDTRLQVVENDITVLPTVNAALTKRGVTLRRAATQAAPDNISTPVSYDTQVEDTGALWDPGTPTVITVDEDGLWAITFELFRAAATTAFSYIQIVPSAGVFATALGALRFPWPIGEQLGTAACVIPLEAGDTFTTVFQLDGAAASTITAALTCYRVAGGA